jgi:hypothetical protein
LAVLVAWRLLALEVDGVDDGVGALGCFECAGEALLAAAVDAIGEDDERLAALLLCHEFVGGEKGGVVEGVAAASSMAATVVTGVVGVCGGCAVVIAGSAEFLERGLKFGAGSGEVLQEFYLARELDDAGLIAGSGEHLFEKSSAGGSLLVEDTALTEAGIDQQAESEGEIGVLVEVADVLGVAVYLKNEVVFSEVLDEGPFLIADDDGEIDEAGIDRERGGGGNWRLFRGDRGLLLGVKEAGKRQDKAGGQAKPNEGMGGHVCIDGHDAGELRGDWNFPTGCDGGEGYG